MVHGRKDKMNIEEINEYLKHNLLKERYEHSLGVMERAEEYAKVHGCDVEIAKIVGLAHDIAKELTIEESLEYAEKNNIGLDEIEKAQPYLLHGKIGAHMCKEKFRFTKQMQEAIIDHTTGSENMDLLAKIILVADKTEKNRRYEDLEYAVSIAKKDINEGVVYCLDKALEKIISRNYLIHPNTIYTRNKLLLEKNNGIIK